MASQKKKNGNGEKKRKLLGILLILFAALLLISLVTHSGWDDRRITSQDNPLKTAFRNQVGAVGAYTSYLFFFFFGWLSIFVPFVLVLGAFRLLNFSWRQKVTPAFWFACSTCILVTMMTNVYLIHHAIVPISYPETNGGYLGYYFSLLFIKIVGSAGSFVILGTGIIAWLVVLGYKYSALTERLSMPFATALTRLGNWAKKIPGRLWEFARDLFHREPS